MTVPQNPILNLNPQSVWKHFYSICQVPHTSGHTTQLKNVLKQQAIDHKFQTKEDNHGNLVIIREAAPQFANKPSVCLQAHLDMVANRSPQIDFNFSKDAIVPQIQTVNGKQCVTATGTTLSADDGIGLAMIMAILYDEPATVKIEALFTNNEETTMEGAEGLTNSFVQSKYLINLDAEDTGVMDIGNSGNITSQIQFPSFKTQQCNEGYQFINVKALNMTKDSMEIHQISFAGQQERSCIQIVNQLLLHAVLKQAKLIQYSGPTSTSYVNSTAYACICIQNDKCNELMKQLQNIQQDLQLQCNNEKIQIIVETVNTSNEMYCISEADSVKMMSFLSLLPQGIQKTIPFGSIYKDSPPVTQTLCNLGRLDFKSIDEEAYGSIKITTLSTMKSQLDFYKLKLNALARLLWQDSEEDQESKKNEQNNNESDEDEEEEEDEDDEFAQEHCTHDEYWEAWNPQTGFLFECASIAFQQVYKHEFKVLVDFDGGLECGIIQNRLKGIEIISFGPTLKLNHTSSEWLDIATTEQCFVCLKQILKVIEQK